MPKYRPIEQPIAIETSLGDLTNLVLRIRALVADFSIPGEDQRALRVEFESVEMIRILDEMALSTEAEDTPNEGLSAHHFAFLVDGARFWNQQSEAFKMVFAKARHFRFITGWTCLDVIAAGEPKLTVVQV
ncbi:hypothetical protein IVB30_08020 [Bradyrhizobium sp. 200]|uniref:hypothetical protein n=1 Tax=Bradyrhizobium sp. 200 TaxID=2782665 RepID=UPI001FFF5891|nr:hypothetical protein [Bradyrhizobium sp. 200]UPJ51285.1 hypothetical protein IVB30_08020 [Bradyrhizobium sp. 200]